MPDTIVIKHTTAVEKAATAGYGGANLTGNEKEALARQEDERRLKIAEMKAAAAGK